MGMNHQAFTALLQDLTVIANVGPNHQLYTHTQVMYSREYTRWLGFYRRAMGEERYVNMERVKSIIDTALSELNSLRAQEHEWGNQDAPHLFMEQQLRQQVASHIRLLQEALYNVRTNGLPKLRNTYKNDSIVTSILDVMDKFIGLALADKKS